MIRPAKPSDEDRIQELGRIHADTAGVPNAFYPSVDMAEWYVIDGKDGQPCCALGLYDIPQYAGDNGIQIMLIWNKGKEQTLAAARLIKFANDLSFTRQRKLWFITIANAPVPAIQCFLRFGFHLAYTNGKFARYERDVA